MQTVLEGQGETETSAYPAPEHCSSGKKSGYCTLNDTQYRICELDGKRVCYIQKATSKDEQSETPIHKMYKRDTKQIPVPACNQCNCTVWIGGKMKSIFVAYFQVNKLCYDNTPLEMCVMGGKTYRVGRNLKYKNRLALNNEPVILDLLEDNDDRVCLQIDKTFCFSRNKERVELESKIKQVAQEFKRQEPAIRQRRIEQERLKTLSEQYDQLEKQYSDWGYLASNRNLFIDLIQEIAIELGLSNCWTCGGLKSAEKWPWKGESLTPDQLLKWDNAQISRTIQRPEGWVLDQRIIGTICIGREGKEYTQIVEYIPCISTLAVNSINKSNVWQPEPPAGYWSHEKGTNWHEKIGLCWNKGSGVNPYQSLEELGGYWNEPEKTKN